MSTPVNPSTEKVRQVYYPLSLKPSNDEEFPLSYADNIWDVVRIGSTLSALTKNTGQFDQHTLNELFAQLLVEITEAIEVIWQQIDPDPPTHDDFTDDFTSDFN